MKEVVREKSVPYWPPWRGLYQSSAVPWQLCRRKVELIYHPFACSLSRPTSQMTTLLQLLSALRMPTAHVQFDATYHCSANTVRDKVLPPTSRLVLQGNFEPTLQPGIHNSLRPSTTLKLFVKVYISDWRSHQFCRPDHRGKINEASTFLAKATWSCLLSTSKHKLIEMSMSTNHVSWSTRLTWMINDESRKRTCWC